MSVPYFTDRYGDRYDAVKATTPTCARPRTRREAPGKQRSGLRRLR
ncbi:hypothetical protein G9272_15275 [Streptomyces asoensis]|uniref:Uncharacterized protein n=1 Tax=Streptomyces asoensis TaxID=249586 RepID=A0A6M4WP71_9ACTN|nr:hypothetical protein [Streptomyces asoensis]QJT01511.1 hypothetical protein G9272_15275 [Streptomyces asoensis]